MQASTKLQSSTLVWCCFWPNNIDSRCLSLNLNSAYWLFFNVDAKIENVNIKTITVWFRGRHFLVIQVNWHLWYITFWLEIIAPNWVSCVTQRAYCLARVRNSYLSMMMCLWIEWTAHLHPFPHVTLALFVLANLITNANEYHRPTSLLVVPVATSHSSNCVVTLYVQCRISHRTYRSGGKSLPNYSERVVG
jgi:hypothetical protein